MAFFETEDYTTLRIDGIAYPIDPRYSINRYIRDDTLELYNYMTNETVFTLPCEEVTEEILKIILKEYGFKENIVNTRTELYLGDVCKTTDWALVIQWVSKEHTKDMWGDDWNDHPYECNAGDIYDEYVDTTDYVVLKPGWVYEELEEFGKYNRNTQEFQWRGIYDHYWDTATSKQELRDNDLVYGRIVNTRTGETIWCKLGQTVRNEFYKELKEKGAID